MTANVVTPLPKALELRGDGAQLHATAAPDWTQGRTMFGGILAALGIRAIGRVVDDGRPLRSFLMNFVAPVEPGQLTIDTRLLRAGRSLLHAEAHLAQNDKVCALMLGAFGARRSSGLRVAGEAMPESPGPDTAFPVEYVPGVLPPYAQHFDYRWTSPYPPFSAAEHGIVGGWIRAPEADAVDPAVLAALTDAFPVAFLPMLHAPASVSTVTWMVNFLGECAGVRPEEFWRVEGDTLGVGDGYASVNARVWSSSGELRVVSRQLVAEFS